MRLFLFGLLFLIGAGFSLAAETDASVPATLQSLVDRHELGGAVTLVATRTGF